MNSNQTATAHVTPRNQFGTDDIGHTGTNVPTLVDRMNVNLLDPIEFEFGEAGNFIKRHRCGLCGSSLVMGRINPRTRKFYVNCPTHGEVYEGSAVKTNAARRAEQAMRSGMMEFWRK